MNPHMSQIIYALIIIFFSLVTHASVPAVDDIAMYKVTTQNDSFFGKEYRHESWLKSVDAAGNTFVLINRISRDDGFLYETSSKVDQDYLSRLYIPDTEVFCKSQKSKATLETITVPAGTFLACKLDNRSIVRWVSSQVPFGLLKSLYFSSNGKIDEEKVLLKWMPRDQP